MILVALGLVSTIPRFDVGMDGTKVGFTIPRLKERREVSMKGTFPSRIKPRTSESNNQIEGYEPTKEGWIRTLSGRMY